MRGKENKNPGAVITFRVQGSGRIQVEVPAEKGDKVRGHRNPSDWETGHPQLQRDVAGRYYCLSDCQKSLKVVFRQL